MTILSNSLADLAERVRAAREASDAAALTTAEKAIETGVLLRQAKAQCQHGEWLPFLVRANIAARHAQRLMQIVAAGANATLVTHFGGVKATVEFLAAWQLPVLGQCLRISSHNEDGSEEEEKPLAIIWPWPESPDRFQVLIFDRPRAEIVISEFHPLGRPLDFDPADVPYNMILQYLLKHFDPPPARWGLVLFPNTERVDAIRVSAWSDD